MGSTHVATTAATAIAANPIIIDTSGLAAVIGVSRVTVQKDLSRAPHRLPPPIFIPGRKGARWLYSDVIRWLESLRGQPQQPAKRRRGRPTKAEQLARQRAAAAGGGQ